MQLRINNVILVISILYYNENYPIKSADRSLSFVH